MSTTQRDQQAEQRKSLYEAIGLQFQATFQPTPQQGVKSPQLHWLITLTTKKGTAQFPYFEGIAHVKGYKQSWAWKMTLHEKEQYDLCVKTCETGKLYTRFDNIGTLGCRGKQPAPSIDDVLYCLCSDASVLDSRSYEDWASDYGYEEDSRKGETTYKQCLEQTKNFQRVIGAANLEKLRDLFQDY